MKKIKLILIFIFSFIWGVKAQTNLASYEYWFNGDYATKQVATLPPTGQHHLAANIDASSLPDGVNVLHIRYKDENGLYSSTLSKVFYKNTALLVPNKKLSEYELWFNNDYGNKQVFEISPTIQHQLITTLDASGLPDGVNLLHIRYKDEMGLFSSTLSKVFYKNTEQLTTGKKLVEYEFWFNNDYNNLQIVPVTATVQHQLVTDIDATVLPDGVNVLNIRYKDEKGIYSSTLSKVFYKPEKNLEKNNKLIAYRYWVDDDFENVVFNHIEPAAKQLNILDNLDMSQLAMGEHTLHFQFLDSTGLWSLVTTNSITKTAIPVSAFSVSNTVLCENSTLQFVNESLDADTWLWNFGDGNTSAEFEPEHVFSAPGDFEVSLTATDSGTGRDSIFTQTLTIYPTYQVEKSAEICEGESYTFEGAVYTESGEYSHTFTSVNGCDSVITLTLTVHPTYNVMYAGEDASSNYLVNDTFEETPLNTFPYDWTILYSGTGYDDHYVVDNPVKNGIHALKVSGSGWAANLSKKVDNIPENVVLEGWIRAENVTSGGRCGLGIGNPDVGSWGAYRARVEFYNGNLITFYYTGYSGGYGTQYVLQPALSNTWYHIKIETDAVAETYKVYINGEQASSTTGGETINDFPLYTNISATSVEIYGNSLIYFDDIKMYENGSSSVIVCENELPYVFGEQELLASGTYVETFQTIYGCDSVVTLNLTVNPVYNHTETASICEGESYNFGGTDYTESGDYAHTFASVNSCDSVVTLKLTVSPVYDVAIADTIYKDELPYSFGGQNLNESGVYSNTFTSIAGCDSAVTLTLTVIEYSVPVAVCHPVTIDLDKTGFYTLSRTDLENIAAGSNDANTGFSDLIISVTPDKFTCENAGKTLDVMVIVTNEDNYSDTCYTAISVADNTPPQVDCRDLEIYLDENGQASIDINETYASSRDACGIEKITTLKEIFTCDDLGYNYFSASVTDVHENKTTCQNILAVFDTIRPVFDPVGNIEVAASVGKCKATINYPKIMATDNCGIDNLFLYEGLGPDGQFPVGTTTERWIAADVSGNNDTLTFEVKVLDNPAAPFLDAVPNTEIPEDADWFTEILTGISDGSECEEYPLRFTLSFENDQLLESHSVNYTDGDNVALLKLLPAQNASGETNATITLTNSETGQETSINFNLKIAPVNDPPYLVHPVQNLVMKAGDSLKVAFSPEKGIIFDDVDENDMLQLSVQPEDGSTLPEWLVFKNDTLWAFPTAADTGCIKLLLVAIDLEGEQANNPFTLCSDFFVGTNLLNTRGLKVYPNPSTGKVYIELTQTGNRKTDVSVSNILGQEILHKVFPSEGRLEIDLSGQVSGMYLFKIRGDGIESNQKIILHREH
ncbi:PKD domain-containing protein [Mariniphaga sediminis]|uniref:PKD domain-containing protein n=1 Tax=Mariniphaga sediminis TaxID=1628158 RepID=UPI0035645AFA